jgi:hypothetical protein
MTRSACLWGSLHLLQVSTQGAVEREFTGFSSKPVSQMAKGEKIVASAAINCSTVRAIAAANSPSLQTSLAAGRCPTTHV